MLVKKQNFFFPDSVSDPSPSRSIQSSNHDLLFPPTALHKATVYWDPDTKTVLLKDGVLDDKGDAYGFYNDSFLETGWGVLELRAGYGSTPRGDDKTFFLAGYLEGFLTARLMIDHYTNMYPQLITRPDVLQAQVKLHETTDPLWAHTGFVLAQLDGLQAGAAEWAKRSGRKALTLFEVQFLNAVGDLLDLLQMLDPEAKPSLRQFKEPPMGHCSALIKVLPGYENVLFAHSSWYVYAATMRIFKHWDFKVQETHTATGKLSFSSYPGFLVSLDDFYLLGSGLMMTQTTNNVFNQSLHELVTPSSLFAWQRVRLANALAHNGQEWAEIFSRYNSGTYNNQYMVLDVSKISLGLRLDNGALTIVEQIPGLVEYSDQTEVLRFGYWPSYNIPFHQRIYTLSGYGEMWMEYGEDFSYELCPRAKIFRRDQASVTDLSSLKHIMRYNDYEKDPYSKGDPCKSICCRGDLRKSNPTPQGCYDTKVTDLHMAQQFVSEALNGPSTEGDLPPFSWDAFNSTMHRGLPRLYNYTFVSMHPVLFTP
ncbi:phospholipase B domain containing 1 precursor [Silurus meridionalis]|nr:phospholipase B domain containing 1 precursor [Silurus meridionalis]